MSGIPLKWRGSRSCPAWPVAYSRTAPMGHRRMLALGRNSQRAGGKGGDGGRRLTVAAVGAAQAAGQMNASFVVASPPIISHHQFVGIHNLRSMDSVAFGCAASRSRKAARELAYVSEREGRDMSMSEIGIYQQLGPLCTSRPKGGAADCHGNAHSTSVRGAIR